MRLPPLHANCNPNAISVQCMQLAIRTLSHKFFFPNPSTLRSSPRAPPEEAVEANSKSHISHITYHYHNFELARTAPPAGALQEPSKSPRRERGVPGVSPERKKNKYYCNVEIFQAFHYWEVRAPSTYFLLLRRGNHTATGHVVAPAVGCNYFATGHILSYFSRQELRRELAINFSVRQYLWNTTGVG